MSRERSIEYRGLRKLGMRTAQLSFEGMLDIGSSGRAEPDLGKRPPLSTNRSRKAAGGC
jgi:hypothetical protein